MKRKRKLTFFDKLILILAVFLAAALIIGSFAWKVDPREHPLLPFFGLAYPFLLGLNFLMIVWWSIRRKWMLMSGTLVIVLLGWTALNSSFGLLGNTGDGSKSNPEAIRMMTYNVHGFTPYGEDQNEMTKQHMLDLLEEENPDIICFQEYFSRKKGSFDITDSLKRILKTTEYYFYPSLENSYEAHGLAVFSKYPIKNRGNISFGDNAGGNASIYVDVEINKKVVRIYNVHLQSISFKEEDYNYLEKVTKNMDPEISSSKRIARMLKNAFIKRSHQVDIMRAHMATCDTPFIIAGDFNDTPASYAVNQLTHSLNNTFVKQGKGFGKTYNGKFPNFQIDYIAATKAIDVLNYRVIEAKLSDHFPVRSDLLLKP